MTASKHSGNLLWAASAPGRCTVVVLGPFLGVQGGSLPTFKLPPPEGAHCGPSREPRARGNAPQDSEVPFPGVNNIQGCGCGLHPGGVAPVGAFSERAVQGGHAGECLESALCGASSS
ncbi:uncharacterized protein LOC100619491 isoform X7 [Monodelphis domestica]|uniref:uncharacterized protein LOC100619491 isoform X7 n=1 Tax=Monodelphis domestica TaxID=13616 RepID=UPI0024E1D18F|nr:uncharacterized protein LOC100619491 isoform X7 [Monodelphis domestica]